MKNLFVNRVVLKLLMLSLSLSILGHCGFRLKENLDLSKRIPNIHVIENRIDPVFMNYLKQSLVDRKIDLDQDSDFLINILSYEESSRAASISPLNANQIDTQIIKSMRYSVIHEPTNKFLIPPNVVRLYKEYTNDNSNLAGKAEEQRLIKKELDEELVQIILRRLQAVVIEHKDSEVFTHINKKIE